MAMRIGVLTFF